MGIISGVSNVGTGVGGAGLTFGVSVEAGASVGFESGALGVTVAGACCVGFGGNCGALGVTAGSGVFAFSVVVGGVGITFGISI